MLFQGQHLGAHRLLAPPPKIAHGCCFKSYSLEVELREEAFVKEFPEKCFYKEKIGKDRRRGLSHVGPWERNCTTSQSILRRGSAFCNPVDCQSFNASC